MDPVDLERMVDRKLKQLPPPHAPRTLAPRVMAAVAMSLVPWYRRPWLTWPVAWQAASVVLLIVLLGDAAMLVPKADDAVGMLVSALFGALPRDLIVVLDRAGQAAALLNVVWQVFLQPVALYVFALAILLSVAFAALWCALDRVALGGASHP